MKLPPVTIIILNWNGADDTLACLTSVTHLDYPSYEAVVIDNGSTDGSVSLIRERFPNVTLIETGQNLGYAGGNNIGLRYALRRGSEYILLLNDDAEVTPNLLHLLVKALQADRQAGVAGPTIYYYDAPEVIWSAGGALDRRYGKSWMIGLNERDHGQFGTQPRAVDFVTGCALLARAKAIREAGLLDERFFMYYEETEWCIRIARSGYRVLHVPAARVLHKISPHAQADSPFVRYYMTRNHLLFLQATGAPLTARLHVTAGYLRLLAVWSMPPRQRDTRPKRRAVAQAIADAWMGRWGARHTPSASGG